MWTMPPRAPASATIANSCSSLVIVNCLVNATIFTMFAEALVAPVAPVVAADSGQKAQRP